MPDAITRPADLIVGRGLITAETIAQELREHLRDELGQYWESLSSQFVLERARDILADYEPIFAENLTITDLAAWVAGFDEVAGEMPTGLVDQFGRDLNPPEDPPTRTIFGGSGDDEPIVRFPKIEKAAESLRKRGLMTRDEFDRASEAIRRQAFTVAEVDSVETLNDIRDALAETVSEGASLEGFRSRLEDRIGAGRLGPSHIENVYRTNVQAAFRDGRESLADNPIIAEVFPYQEYLAISDGRTRDNHLALETLGLDGTAVYRRDDPMWELFTPPWDFQCRCGVNLLTIEAAARKGVKEAKAWLRTGIAPAYPEWRLPFIPFRSRPGWGARKGVAA